MYVIKLESLVWAYDEKCVQCIKYQLFIWNYVNGIVLCNGKVIVSFDNKEMWSNIKGPYYLWSFES